MRAAAIGCLATALVACASPGGSGGSNGGATGHPDAGDAGPTGFPIAPHQPFPTVPKNGGPTITTPVLETLTYADDAHAADERGWAAWVVGSRWLAQVGAD